MKSFGRIVAVFAMLAVFTASQARAETFVVGYQPYDTISYQVIVNAELGLWKKYVPKGTEIEFQGALQGTVVANNMLAGKAQVGYMSVMPATILCSKPKLAKVVMVATAGMSEGTRCSLVLVRKNAPAFKSNEELARWLDGKVIAAPKGSASDQYLLKFFEKYHVKPGEYLNQSIEVIGTNFRVGKLDAASLWEPTLSRIASDVGEGVARIVADGRACDNPDLGIVTMRKDFMEQHPQVAKGYLRSELEAQRYILDPKNWSKVIDMVSKHAAGVPKRVLWYSIYGQIPADSKDPVREWKSFYFNELERKNIAEVGPFLLKDKRIKDLPTADAVDDSLARQVFKEAGYTPVSSSVTLGVIKGAPASACPFKD
ncbi:MAG: nitrate ABC transporter substrate-binding protein [Deltaproteobacteria bacterium HGW-Deltaproteobacteria-8]|jgi:NitT/TauT family transport system substrate-binding protein|nr:MAG: nitrate ABC transporter substrate-binding protein [Deltaproteobacteria bacterium HGW-Deltaproteobacteria-8]